MAYDLGVLLCIKSGEMARTGFDQNRMNINIKVSYAMYAKIVCVSWLTGWVTGASAATTLRLSRVALARAASALATSLFMAVPTNDEGPTTYCPSWQG